MAPQPASQPAADASVVDVMRWLEDFTYIVHVIATGIGSQEAIDRWRRAKGELFGVSPMLASDFEAKARHVFDQANAAAEEYSQAPAEYHGAVLNGFICRDVDEFLAYLRDCSHSLRPRLRDAAKANEPTRDGEQFVFAREGDGYCITGFGEAGHVTRLV